MTIRRVPEDFVVEELASAAFAEGLRDQPWPGAAVAVYELTKTSLTTPEAVQWFARTVGIKSGVVDYGGLKDKHARTVQLVSFPWSAASGQGQVPETCGDRGWSARRLGWHTRPVAAPEIDGNRFAIVIRDLSRGAAQEMGRRAGLLERVAAGGAVAERELVFVNYFGDQRFGSARHGHGFAAQHLVRGEFEQAIKLLIATPARKDSGKTRLFSRVAAGAWGRWAEMLETLPRCAERGAIETLAGGKDFRDAFAALPHFTQQICVEAYQSYLWNQIASRLARRIAAAAAPAGSPTSPPLLEAADDFGTMLFPPARAVGEEWLTVAIPTLGPEAAMLPPWKEHAEEVLSAEGLTLEQLRIPGLRRPAFGAADRPLLALARGFSLAAPEPDDLSKPGRVRRTAGFVLPRGAYATVLLRALGQ